MSAHSGAACTERECAKGACKGVCVGGGGAECVQRALHEALVSLARGIGVQGMGRVCPTCVLHEGQLNSCPSHTSG